MMLSLKNLTLWVETFGKKEDPALVLIMAAGGQGIMWPLEFCEKLSSAGFFVIRFDHRDMGLSTGFNYAVSPYDLSDMARDIIEMLDALFIKEAHFVGLSMGGALSLILGKQFSERVKTLTLINSTGDLSIYVYPEEERELPKPQRTYLEFVKIRDEAFARGVSTQAKVVLLIQTWRILNGDGAKFDEKLYESLVRESLERAKNPNGFQNHLLAMKASLKMLDEVLLGPFPPTLIIHGTLSPVFSKEHGLVLSHKIPNGQLEFIQGMGHILNAEFYEKLIELISAHATKNWGCSKMPQPTKEISKYKS